MIITRKSPLTGKVVSLDLPVSEAQMREFNQPSAERRYVQDIFPNLTASQREFLLTGLTAEDWTKAFGEEEA